MSKAEGSAKKHISVVNSEFKGIGKTINVNEHFQTSSKKTESEAKAHVGRMNSIFSHVGEGIKHNLEGIFSGAMSVVGGGAILGGLQKIEQTTEKLLEIGMEHQSAWYGAMKRMTAFTGSAVEADKILSEIHELAVDRALEFKPLSEAAFKLTEIGYKGPEIITMFKGITAQAIALGKGTEGVTRLIGMLQMIEDSGKAAGRGLMQLQRQGYQIFGTLSKVTGLDKKFLSKALMQGRLDPRAAIGMLTEGWEEQFGELAGKLSHGFKDEQTRFSEMAAEPLATVVAPMIKAAKHTLVDLQKVFAQVGPGLAEGLGAGLGYAADKLTAGLDYLIELAGVKLKTNSPSKVFEQYGIWVMQGLGDGFIKGSDHAQQALQQTYDKILSNETLQKMVREAASTFNVPAELINAVMAKESSGVANARSPKGAVGLMQFTKGTGDRYGISDRTDPRQSIMGGAHYLSDLLKMFGGDIKLALAGYNAGEGAVQKYGNKIPPYAETQEYVTRISRLLGSSGSIPQSQNLAEQNKLEQAKQATQWLPGAIAKLNEQNTELFGRINRLRTTLGYIGVGEETSIYNRTPEPGVYPKAIAPGGEEERLRNETRTNLTQFTAQYGDSLKQLEAYNQQFFEASKTIQEIQAKRDAESNAHVFDWFKQAANEQLPKPTFSPLIQFEPPKLKRGITGGIIPEREPSELEKEMRETGKQPGLFRREAIKSVKPLEGFQDIQIDEVTKSAIRFHAALSKLERSALAITDQQEGAIAKVLQKESINQEELNSIKELVKSNREYNSVQKQAILAGLENNQLTKEQSDALRDVIFKFESVRNMAAKSLNLQVIEAPGKIRESEADILSSAPERIGQVANEFLTKFDFTWKGAQQILIGGLKSVIIEPVAHVFQQMVEKWVAQQLLNILGDKITGTAKVTSETLNTGAVTANTIVESANTVALIANTAALVATTATSAGSDILHEIIHGAAAGGRTGGVVRAYATGTLNFPGGIGMVGEEGPEMVHLPTGSHIYNHNETKAMMRGKGGNTNINITLNAPVMGGSGYSTPKGKREYLEMLIGPLQEAMGHAM